MTRHIRILPVFLVGLVALLLVTAALELRADDEAEFDEFEVFIEINATDGDAGLQANVDGEAWNKLEVEDANGNTVVKLKLRNALRKQGLTELAWESNEPTFDEFSLEEFLERFPPGTYEAEATTIAGGELESETELTHNLPAGPTNIELSENNGLVTVTWDQVTEDYRGGPLGGDGIVGYEVIIECEDAAGDVVQAITREVPGDPSSPEATFPADIFDNDLDCKIEILAMEASGNRTATEMEVEL